MRNIFPTILLVIAIGGFFMYVKPHWDGIKVLQTEADQYNQALTKSKELQRMRDVLIEKYNQVEEKDKQNLLKLLPDSVNNVQLIIDLSAMAKDKFGLQLKNIKNVNSSTANAEKDKKNAQVIKEDNSKYGTASLGFTVTSSYGDFVRFLSELERSLRLIDITDISFNSNESGIYDFNVSLKTYWLK